MPRSPDRQLHSRILTAAYRLWIQHGEHGLTMRAVARAARTTTPTLYERFKDRDALLQALRERAQLKLFEAVQSAPSISEICRRALEFSSTHHHEYELLSKTWALRLSRGESTPSFDLLNKRLAEQFGGAPDDHLQLALALVMLFHGASTLLVEERLEPKMVELLKESCIASVDALLETAERKSSKKAAD
jgi:AcrR family transcriptional regulator